MLDVLFSSVFSGLLAHSGFPVRDFPDRQRRIELDLGPIRAA
jgi:hypothetical protein